MQFLLIVAIVISALHVVSAWTHFGAMSNTIRRPTNLAMSSKYLGSEPIFVAGGSSGVGLELIKKLSAMGTPVKVLVRRPDAAEELSRMPGVTVAMGDAMDEAAVQSCMEGCIAAVTTLGGQPQEDHEERVDYAGNSNVIEQAGILGVERIILVTRYCCNRIYWSRASCVEPKSFYFVSNFDIASHSLVGASHSLV